MAYTVRQAANLYAASLLIGKLGKNRYSNFKKRGFYLQEYVMTNSLFVNEECQSHVFVPLH